MDKMGKEEEAQKVRNQLQVAVENYQKVQKKYDKLVRQHGQLDTQLNENQMVKEELGLVKEDSKVFKLLGDVLVPQTLIEASTNVGRRMEYIQSELSRNNDQLQSYKTEMGSYREDIGKFEVQLQAHLQQS